MAALEVARSALENPTTAGLAVDIASWIEEEGTYLGFLGARSFCGLQDMSLVDTAFDHDGRALTTALAESGFAVAREWRWRRVDTPVTWRPTSSRVPIWRPEATESAS